MQEVIRTDAKIGGATVPPAPDRLAAILDRATEINLRLVDLCRLAKLPGAVSTIYRWKAGSVQPGLGRYGTVCRALEGALTAEEDRLRQVLAA